VLVNTALTPVLSMRISLGVSAYRKWLDFYLVQKRNDLCLCLMLKVDC
jgi:hypothetical protein